MKRPAFDYRAPTSLEEAAALLASHEGARPLAGGQSLLPLMAFRLAQPSMLVDLARIPGLNEIRVDERGASLGSLATWRQIEMDESLRNAQPLLASSIQHIAHYQIRNRGTVGGSLAHADPAAEFPLIALTCEAQVETFAHGGERMRSASGLFLGALTTSLEPDEIIVAIRFPAWPLQRRWAFEEFARRRGDFALAAAAVFFDLDNAGRAINVHIGAIGALDAPLRLREAEQVVNGRPVDERAIADAGEAAAAQASPTGDIHGDSAYRKALVGTLVRRALARAASLK